MLILRCPAQLQRLEETLRRSIPAALPVLGTVMTVARGNPASYEVLVDSWPHFGVVLTRLRPEDNKDPRDFYANQLTVFYQDEGAWRALLGGTEVVDWTRAFQIHGMQDGVYEAVREVTDAKGLQRETHKYQALLSPQPPQPRVQMPAGLHLAPVSPSHVPLPNATWSTGGNTRSQQYLLGLLRALPSACLLGPRGLPVSWSILDPLGCLTHGYTVPAWRGRGLCGLILGALGKELHARGYPIYAGVLPNNIPSQRALRGLGFLPQPGTYYTLVVTPPVVPRNGDSSGVPTVVAARAG